ncbi:Afadin and alpha-actinin-binding-domain-containing protein [Pseudoneurospora amorphoporcata]|uniref:Afadin and alpha-actinin-binding-domain-containing protein n=1 Tax=Pseudoneurospora amorphoporcata TaxID=241081 RepID=A0AAN6NY12_9PEZI|nr:Afadin and alpha-actinin-binding-domain-containing protein [Pseudoneurospora amorphoporcata]
MIISDNLRTASIYINNQLLSRGLLRDGDNIDFAYPGDNDDELAHTMGRIMGVVNDLILRRDRDAETRESLSQTLRSLRAESLRQTTDIVRLSDKLTDSSRKTALAEQEAAHARAQLTAAEQTVTKLKEEAARQKSLVQQTRNACANEIRKRDRMIEGLKKAVADAGRTRGTGHTRGASRDGGFGGGLGGQGGGVMSIVVQAGEEYNAEAGGKMGVPQGMTGSEGYDLRMETNGFLAELAKGLSEENEVLLGLVRRTVRRMQEMSGWDVVANVVAQKQQQQQKDEGGDINMDGGETRKEEEEDKGEKHALVIPTSCDELQRDLENVLEHMRIILTNPSFVPIEEVVVREDEIHRLRDGWVKMESRWKEAVHLIDGWRNRMQVSGRPVNVEELKMGLRLSPVKVKNVAETAHGLQLEMPSVREEEDAEEQADREEVERYLEKEKADAAAAAAASTNASGPRSRDSSLHLVPAPPGGVPDDPMDEDSEQSSIFEDDDLDLDDLDDDEEPNVEVLGHSLMLSSPPLSVPPQLGPLKDSPAAGNRGGFGQPNLRRGGGDYTNDLRAAEVGPPVPPHADKPQQTKKSIRPVRQQEGDASVSEREQSRPSTAPSTTSAGSIKLVKAETSGPKAASAARKRPGTATTTTSATGPTARTRSRTRTAESDREVAAPVTRSRAREEAATSGGTGRAQTTATGRKPATDRSRPPITRATTSSAAPGTRGKSQTRSLTSSGKGKETESKTGPKFVPGHRRTNSEKTTYSTASGPGTPGREREIASSHSRPTTSNGLTKTREAALLAQSPKLAPSPRLTKGLATANNSENGSSTDSANRSGGGAISQSPINPNRSPRRTGNSRLPLPRTGLVSTAALQAQQSPLNVATIAAKLAASEREADAARVRAKLKAMKRSKQESVGPSQSQRSANGASQRQSQNQSQPSEENQPTNGRATPMDMDCDNDDENQLTMSRRRPATPGRQSKTPKAASRAAREEEAEPFDFEQEQQEQEDEEVDELAGPENHDNYGMAMAMGMGMGMEKLHVQKRKREKMRTSRTASRRRSTLNPWELQSLLQGSVKVAPPMPPPSNPMTAGMGGMGMTTDVGMEG